MLSAFAVRLARFAVHRPWLALALGLGLCVVASLGALRVQLVTDLAGLLPEGSPAIQRLRSLDEHFDAGELVVVALRELGAADDKDRQTVTQQVATARAMADALAGWRWQRPGADTDEAVFLQLDGPPDPDLQEALRERLLPQTWLLLPDEDLPGLLRRLEPRRLAARLERPPVGVPPELQASDPLGLWTDLYLPWWRSRLEGDLPLSRRSDGWLATRDGRALVLVLRAAHGTRDSVFVRHLGGRLERWRDEQRQSLAREGSLQLDVLGGYLPAAHDYATASSSAWLTLLTSMTGVLLLFALAYRSLRIVTLIAVSLLPAIGAALGLAALALGGQLSMIVSAFAAILIGLGVDFVIHIHNGYSHALAARRLDAAALDRRKKRRLRGEIAVEAMARVGPGVIAGALTSIATFLVLLTAHYRGFWELGAVCGLGLGIILVQMLVVAPAWLTLTGSLRPRRSRLMRGYCRSLLRWPRRWTLGLILLIAAAALVLGLADEPLRFDRNPRNLRPTADAVWDEQISGRARLGVSSHGNQLLFEGPDPAQVAEAAGRYAVHLRELSDPAPLLLAEPLRRVDLDAALPLLALAAVPDALLQARLRAWPVLDSPWGRLAHGGYDARAGGLRDLRLLAAPSEAEQPEASASLEIPPLLTRWPTPLDWFVPPSQQQQRLARMAEGLDQPGLEALLAELDPELRRRRAPFLAELNQMLSRVAERRPLRLTEFADGPLAPLIGAYLRADATGCRLRLPLQLAHDEPALLADTLSALDLDAHGSAADGEVSFGLTGPHMIAVALHRILVEDFQRLGLVAVGITTLLLVLLMPSLGSAGLALAALGGGLLVTAAVLRLIDMPWNLMNTAMVPLIIGIGIDNGIHFLHSLHRSGGGQRGVHRALNTTGQALVMTSLTSIVGFGSLAISAYRGIQSVGLTAVIGIASCLIVALLLLPLAGLKIPRRKP